MEQGGWCNLFWDKDSKEKEQGIIMESPIKNLWKLFYYGKKEKHFWCFLYISVYFLQKDQLGDVPKLDIPITKQVSTYDFTVFHFVPTQIMPDESQEQ